MNGFERCCKMIIENIVIPSGRAHVLFYLGTIILTGVLVPDYSKISSTISMPPSALAAEPSVVPPHIKQAAPQLLTVAAGAISDDGETVSGVDLAANPYVYKGKVIVLKGVQYDRMIDAHTAILKCVVVALGYGGPTSQEILVTNVPSDLFSGRQFVVIKVKVLGMAEGNNALGGPVRVPHVQFVGTVGQDSAPRSSGCYESEILAIQLAENPFACQGRTIYLKGIMFDRMIDENTAIVKYRAPGGWAGLTPISVDREILVSGVPSTFRSRGMIELKVKVLGMKSGRNALGGPVRIPHVEFISEGMR